MKVQYQTNSTQRLKKALNFKLIQRRNLSYSFSDPNEYQGPVVKGWPPTKSRDMRLYIRTEDEMIINDISCLEDLSNVKVVIFVQSAPKNKERRQMTRKTWMQFQAQYPFIKTIFLFGKQDPNEAFTSIQ